MQKVINIIYSGPCEVIHHSIVYLPVQVNQPVTKAHHPGQGLGKLMLKGTCLLHDLNSISIVIGGRQPILGNEMVTDINYTLDSDDQIVLGTGNLVLISEKLSLGEIPQLLEIIHRSPYFASEFEYPTGVKFQRLVPP